PGGRLPARGGSPEPAGAGRSAGSRPHRDAGGAARRHSPDHPSLRIPSAEGSTPYRALRRLRVTPASGPVHSASRYTFHLIPHTHWDREWYLPRAAFLARLVPALDDLIDRLERQPAFRSFLLDGQSVLLEDYLRVRPEQSERVHTLVRTGRLQVGPWYVLADELVPSGESLVRNLLLGVLDSERLGGRCDVLYSP